MAEVGEPIQDVFFVTLIGVRGLLYRRRAHPKSSLL